MIDFDMLAEEVHECRRFTDWLEAKVAGLGPDESLIDMVQPDDSAPNAPSGRETRCS